MSVHEILNGYNPSCVLILPMLGRRQNEYPRFRDCYISDNETIVILTRCGGKYRNSGYGEAELYDDPNFLRTDDMEEDSTYATFEFSVPEEWSGDFYHIMSNEMLEVSDEYIERVKEFYPALSASGRIDEAFGRKKPAKRKKRR